MADDNLFPIHATAVENAGSIRSNRPSWKYPRGRALRPAQSHGEGHRLGMDHRRNRMEPRSGSGGSYQGACGGETPVYQQGGLEKVAPDIG